MAKSIDCIHCVCFIVWLCNSMQKKITRQKKFAGLLTKRSLLTALNVVKIRYIKPSKRS